MKLVKWTDDKDWLHYSLIRDTDPDEKAPRGIPQDPPDVSQLDWEGIKRDLHNELSTLRLLTWADVEVAQNALGPVALRVLVRRLRELYGATRTHSPAR